MAPKIIFQQHHMDLEQMADYLKDYLILAVQIMEIIVKKMILLR